jgi:hypothetical protein
MVVLDRANLVVNVLNQVLQLLQVHMGPLHALVVVTHVGQHAVHAPVEGYKALGR